MVVEKLRGPEEGTKNILVEFLVGRGVATAGYLPPVAGAVFQEVIDVAAVLNALRAALPPRSLTDSGSSIAMRLADPIHFYSGEVYLEEEDLRIAGIGMDFRWVRSYRSRDLRQWVVKDRLFVLFSHHTSRSMGNVLPDRRRPLDPRMNGEALVKLLQRFPNGATGPNFYQKRIPETAPEWLQTTIVSTPNGTESRALVAADVAHVAWAVNMGCLGFHVWPSKADDHGHADELRIDLDPTDGVTFDMVREGAWETKKLLDELGVDASPDDEVGRLNMARRQMVEIARALSMDARVIVMHHNPVRGELSQRHGLKNTKRILGAFAELGVDLVLCGHDHQEAIHYVEHTRKGTVISTAGTVSNRSRGGRRAGSGGGP